MLRGRGGGLRRDLPLPPDRWADVGLSSELLGVVFAKLCEIVVVVMEEGVARNLKVGQSLRPHAE